MRREGPDWVPAVLSQRLGPLTYMYLVETEDGRRPKRHINHLKSTGLVPSRSSQDAESKELDFHLPTPPPAAIVDSSPLQILPPRPPSPSHLPLQSGVSSQQDNPPTLPVPSSSARPSMPARHYPSRTRREPDRYRDTYIYT